MPEVPFDEDDQSSDGASDSQLPDERRKLIPRHQKDRQVKPASSQTKYGCTSKIVVEESTDDDPLPEGYLYTFRGIRCVKPSMKLTSLCGAEEGLHKLTSGHWIATPTPQPCGVNCRSPSSQPSFQVFQML